MKDQLISFETAKLAKEKSFNEKTPEYYNSQTKVTSTSYNEIPAPTQSLLQKWLREKHDIFVSVEEGRNPSNYYPVMRAGKTEHNWKYMPTHWGDTYEEALEKGLVEALNLL